MHLTLRGGNFRLKPLEGGGHCREGRVETEAESEAVSVDMHRSRQLLSSAGVALDGRGGK